MKKFTEEEVAETSIVVSATRRYVFIALPDGTRVRAKLRPKLDDVAVGDRVTWSSDGSSKTITAVLPRRNLLSRSFRGTTKRLAANVDLAVIVTAPPPLFNAKFIDRVLAVTGSEGVPALLVINKSDLGRSQCDEIAQRYSSVTTSLVVSAHSNEGLAALQEILRDPALKIVTLAGVSGVGKTTILSSLVPSLELRVREVSPKTGQGRQTTSQAIGFDYPRGEGANALLVDLPGIQSFGVTHLSKEQILSSFTEFTALVSECEYSNCSHIAELVCGVKRGLEMGSVAKSRYDSYLDMINELELAREY